MAQASDLGQSPRLTVGDHRGLLLRARRGHGQRDHTARAWWGIVSARVRVRLVRASDLAGLVPVWPASSSPGASRSASTIACLVSVAAHRFNLDRQPGTRRRAWPERGILPAVKNLRVERLNYEFRSLEDRHDFSQAIAWEGDLGHFRCRLHQGILEVRPQAQYTSVDAARQALERHLRAWELWSELNNSIRVEFRYKSAQVVDRQSTPDSVSVAAHPEVVEVVVVANDATVKLGHGEYPPPSPKQLATSPLVEELLGWVRDLREGRQRMLVLTYLFFTRLQYEYNGEVAAAAALKVSRKVLVTLRKLAAKNDPNERRKVEGPIQRLTEAERGWITAALPRLTQQVAEIEAGSSPPKLNMGPPGLPRL
jgi:hypothetical protein